MTEQRGRSGPGDERLSGEFRRTSTVPPPMTPGWLEGASAPHLPVLQWRNIVVMLERGLSERIDYVRATDFALDHARRYPRGLGVLTVLSPDVTVPAEASRLAMQEAYARIGQHVVGLAFCVEGADFRGAALRAALAGIKLSLRAAYPVKIFSDLTEAAQFIAQQTQQGSLLPVDPHELVHTVQACRARLDTARAL